MCAVHIPTDWPATGPVSVEAVPESYAGREQAYIKHMLLGGYLRRLFVIVGNSLAKFGLDSLCYVPTGLSRRRSPIRP